MCKQGHVKVKQFSETAVHVRLTRLSQHIIALSRMFVAWEVVFELAAAGSYPQAAAHSLVAAADRRLAAEEAAGSCWAAAHSHRWRAVRSCRWPAVRSHRWGAADRLQAAAHSCWMEGGREEERQLVDLHLRRYSLLTLCQHACFTLCLCTLSEQSKA